MAKIYLVITAAIIAWLAVVHLEVRQAIRCQASSPRVMIAESLKLAGC